MFPDAPAERTFSSSPAAAASRRCARCCITCWRSIAAGGLSLVYSARMPEEFAFDAELRALARQSGLHYYADDDQARGGWVVGRPARIDGSLLAQCVTDPATLCFVCGPESLVHEVPRMLRELGIADARIRVEEWAAATESAK